MATHNMRKTAMAWGEHPDLWITSFLLIKEALPECQLVKDSIAGRRWPQEAKSLEDPEVKADQ